MSPCRLFSLAPTCVICAAFGGAGVVDSLRGRGGRGPDIQHRLLRCSMVPPHVHLGKQKKRHRVHVHRIRVGRACGQYER